MIDFFLKLVETCDILQLIDVDVDVDVNEVTLLVFLCV